MITQLQLTLDRNISKLSWTCVRRMSWTGKTGCACLVFYCDWLGYVALFHFRCLCQDGKTTEKAPFDILKTINCRPKKVIGFVSTIKCPTNCQPTLDEGQIILPTFLNYLFQCKCNGNNKVKVVQEFGCEKGGYPICNEKEPGVFNLACKDGTRLTFPFILQWNLDTLADQWRLGKDFKGCLCPDGIMPRFVNKTITNIYTNKLLMSYLFTDAKKQRSCSSVQMVIQ